MIKIHILRIVNRDFSTETWIYVLGDESCCISRYFLLLKKRSIV